MSISCWQYRKSSIESPALAPRARRAPLAGAAAAMSHCRSRPILRPEHATPARPLQAVSGLCSIVRVFQQLRSHYLAAPPPLAVAFADAAAASAAAVISAGVSGTCATALAGLGTVRNAFLS